MRIRQSAALEVGKLTGENYRLLESRPDRLQKSVLCYRMAIVIYVASALLSLCVPYLLRQVESEYYSQSRLSAATAFCVWIFYLAEAGLTIWSAGISLWRIPLNAMLALILGLTLLLGGAGVCMTGVVAFGSLSRMSGMDASRLITRGIYRWSRNPQNVGLGVVLIGIALIGRSGFALLLTAFFWLGIRIYLPIEEAYLRHIFGECFEDYCRRTSRYVGIQSR